MDSRRAPLLILTLLFMSSFSVSYGLSMDFYAFSCPTAELIVRETVTSATSTDPTIPGKLLRLLFHDCFVEGCDASVLLEGKGTERDDPANASLGGFQVIDSAKTLLEMFCPETVSCADVLALAARDAVILAGGPAVEIPTGRRDGRVSAVSNVRPSMVDTSFTLDQMAQHFHSKGLSLDDLVILSGAHTIGLAHCGTFNDRFHVDSNGNLTFVDSSLDKAYAAQLTKQCAATPSATVSIDPQTSMFFDNQYYKNLVAKRGLFQSDSNLFNDPRTKNLVLQFAEDENSFLERWIESFLKLMNVGIKTSNEGEIRRTCSRTNG